MALWPEHTVNLILAKRVDMPSSGHLMYKVYSVCCLKVFLSVFFSVVCKFVHLLECKRTHLVK